MARGASLWRVYEVFNHTAVEKNENHQQSDQSRTGRELRPFISIKICSVLWVLLFHKIRTVRRLLHSGYKSEVKMCLFLGCLIKPFIIKPPSCFSFTFCTHFPLGFSIFSGISSITSLIHQLIKIYKHS